MYAARQAAGLAEVPGALTGTVEKKPAVVEELGLPVAIAPLREKRPALPVSPSERTRWRTHTLVEGDLVLRARLSNSGPSVPAFVFLSVPSHTIVSSCTLICIVLGGRTDKQISKSWPATRRLFN